MGLFFLLSGYFSPFSCDRIGAGKYLKSRLIHLGIPSLAFYFLLNHLTIYMSTFSLSPAQLVQQGYSSQIPLSWSSCINATGSGPMWFVGLLILFELGYVAWRELNFRAQNGNVTSRIFPSSRRIALFIVVLAVSTYLIRIVLPINSSFLGFPSLFDLPQYLELFAIGIAASRRKWLDTMPDHLALRFFKIALIASVTLLPLALIGEVATNLG